MKKLFLALLSALLALALAVPAFAADGDAEYDEAELKATLREAFDLYDCFFGEKYASDFEGEEVSLFPELQSVHIYKKRTGKYRMWNDVISALNISYTEAAKNIFLKKIDGTEIDGFTYSNTVYGMVQASEWYIESERSGLTLDKSFKITDADGNKITAQFTLDHGTSAELQLIDFTVEFTKENDKWLVSGGTFFEDCIASLDDSPFVTGQTAPPTGDAEYDEDELKATLREAFDLYDCFEGARTESDFVGEPEFLFPNLPKIDPYLYTRRTGKYALWKDVLAYLDASYTKEAKEIFIRKMDGGEVNGYTYTDWTNAQVQGYFLIETDRISLDQTFKITDVSEDKITASFQIEHAIMEAEFLDYTVEFTKENGKWLVSGGTFFEECIASRKDSLFVTEKVSPPTGDATPVLIVLAAVSALTAVISRRRIRAR